MRSSIVRELGGYDPAAGDIVSDYDLWLRIGRVSRIANIEEPLYQWRRSNSSLSMADRQLAIDQTFALRDREFPRLLENRRAFRLYTSFHPGSFFPTRGDYLRKKATLFRSLAYLYRREGRARTAIAMQGMAVLHQPLERRNLLYLALLIRDRSRRQLWDFEFV